MNKPKVEAPGAAHAAVRYAAWVALSAMVLAAGITPAGADAPSPADRRSGGVTIRYADLDLSRRSDATELYLRISRAAVSACQPFDSRSSYEQQRMQSCISTAIARAIDRVDQPQLYAVYQARSGVAAPQLASLDKRSRAP